MGGGGVIAGLAAIGRGARYPPWLLITVALVAVAALAVLVLRALAAGGHLDVLAAAASLAGLTILRASGPTVRPGRALAAGMLVGVAADIMLTYLLFGLALAWGLRRSPTRLAAALAGVCVTLGPAYAWIRPVIFRNLARRQGKVGADTFYQLISDSFRHTLPPAMTLVVELAFIALAALLLWRLPDATPGRPAIRPALALSIAWLFIWYYPLPWYDTMVIGPPAAYPASPPDRALPGQMTAGTA